MGICTRYSRVFWAYDTENNRIILGRLRCKQWSCPHCAIENRKMWRKFLNGKLPQVASDWYLLTLTAREDRRGRIDSYKSLQRGIDVLMKRFRRAFGRVEYVRIYEKHPASEALHAHIIITGVKDFVQVARSGNGRDKYTATNFRAGKRGFWALRTFAKKTSRASGMGYMVDIKPLTGAKRAVKYVTAYMTKSVQDFDIKGLRHVQTSRAIGSPKPPKSKATLYVGYRFNRAGLIGNMRVLDIDTGELIEHSYWNYANVYPPLDENQ